MRDWARHLVQELLHSQVFHFCDCSLHASTGAMRTMRWLQDHPHREDNSIKLE